MRKILIVDDESEPRKICRKLLERQEFIIDEAVSGEQAIEKIGQNIYEGIVLDVYMQFMGGIDCLKEIRKIDKNLPVFMYTDFYNEQVIRESEINNATGFFQSKVFSRRDMLQIAELIDEYKKINLTSIA
jgi:DNA-binding NtrC family response regulator